MRRRKRLALVLELAAWLFLLAAVAYLWVMSAEPETPTQVHVVETR